MTSPSEELRRISRELSELADTDLGDGSAPLPLSRVRLLQTQETMLELYNLLRRAAKDDIAGVLFTSSLCMAVCTVSSECCTAASKVAMGRAINEPFPWDEVRTPL